MINRYPAGRSASALLPLLDLAQRQNGRWLSPAALAYVADFLGLSPLKVREVASFYTMFNLEPVGRYEVQVCRTTPCCLCGAEDLWKTCRAKLAVDEDGGTTRDGLFSLKEVECLGACVNAPVVQINDSYYENLTPESLTNLLDTLAATGTALPKPER
jgi:NADH-quinone oxidoreductase E subunit